MRPLPPRVQSKVGDKHTADAPGSSPKPRRRPSGQGSFRYASTAAISASFTHSGPSLTDDEARNCTSPRRVSVVRRRYETSTLAGARAGHFFFSWLRRARFLLRCGTAATAGRLWCRGLRAGTGLLVDRWFLGLAQSLRLGAGVLVASAAPACAMGAGSRLLQQPPLLLSPRPLALRVGFAISMSASGPLD